MADGFVPGASGVSGHHDASFFNHQPPTVTGFGNHTEFSTPEEGRSTPDISTPTRHDVGPHMPSRAHFPEDVADLEHRISAPPQRIQQSTGSTVESEKESYRTEPRGFWQHLSEYFKTLGEDLGPAALHQDITNLIGDAGIDLHALRKIRARPYGRVSQLVGSSLALSSPGFVKHQDSHSNSASGQDTGVATPTTPTKHHGVDPKDVSKALHNLKAKIENSKDPKELKYVQAKGDLAHRRNLVLLLTYAFMLYGAPSHRIEEYILALFKVCDIDGRVNYTVGKDSLPLTVFGFCLGSMPWSGRNCEQRSRTWSHLCWIFQDAILYNMNHHR